MERARRSTIGRGASSPARTTFHDPAYVPDFDVNVARHATLLCSELFKCNGEPVTASPVPPDVPTAPGTGEPRTALLDGRSGDELKVILDRAAVYGLRRFSDLKYLLNLIDDSTVGSYQPMFISVH